MESQQIISREEAVSLGLKRYFTGEACKAGHTLERLTSNRACLQCGKLRKLAWAASNTAILAKRARKRRAEEPQKFRNYDRVRYQSDPRLKMLTAAKQRAKLKGIPFSITIDDIEIPDTCPLLGVTLAISGGMMGENSPSLDRIRNNIGYVRGNVLVVSYLANRCKGRLQADDLLKLASNLKTIENQMPEWLAQDKGFI